MTAPEQTAPPLDVAANLAGVRARIAAAARRAGRDPAAVRLVAVSKRQPLDKLRQAYAAGQRVFGENYVQEALEKMEHMPADTVWHMIGHVQTNKARQVAGRFACVETVDSLRIAQHLAREAGKAGLGESRPAQDVLVQVNLTREASKAGLTGLDALRELLAAVIPDPRLRVRGLMTIPDPALGGQALRGLFGEMRQMRERLASEFGLADTLTELSMGMSHDYECAIEEGATLVRVGTAIFGARP